MWRVKVYHCVVYIRLRKPGHWLAEVRNVKTNDKVVVPFTSDRSMPRYVVAALCLHLWLNQHNSKYREVFGPRLPNIKALLGLSTYRDRSVPKLPGYELAWVGRTEVKYREVPD